MLQTMCSKTFSLSMMRTRFFIQSLTFQRSIIQLSVTTRSTIKNLWSLFVLSRNDDQSLKTLFILLRWSWITKTLSISCQLSSWVIIKLIEVSFCLDSTITSLIISTRSMISWMLWHVAQYYERAQSFTETHVLETSLDFIEFSAFLSSVHIVFASW